MYIDIRQSLQFANFMQDIGWKVVKIDSCYIYLRQLPFVGFFAKMPRAKSLVEPALMKTIAKKNHIFKMKISPHVISTGKNYFPYKKKLLKNNWRIDLSPFNPTTTIHIDLTQSEKQIFQNFKEAKRRGVRKAIKNGIIVQKSNDLDEFIKIRKRQYFPFGFLITGEMKALWKNFYPKDVSLLLAYKDDWKTKETVAGILLLFYDHTAYYWFASSLPIGKKLFAPTLLVWEALKLAKKKGCKIFDFEGIYDERFLKASQSWKGFTKFKEGFGGEKIVYLDNFTK